jgi:hypothetical protein
MHNLQKYTFTHIPLTYKFQSLVMGILQNRMPFFQTRRNVPEDKGNCDSGWLSKEIMRTASYLSALAVGNIMDKFVSHTHTHTQQQLTQLF